MIDVSKIEYTNFNERDIEVPGLISVISKYKPESVLDVGAHYSWYTYANKVKELVPPGKYEALDLLEDEKTAKIVDKYHVVDVTKFALCEQSKFDLVFSVSVLEHVGINPTRTPDVMDRRKSLVESVIKLSEKVAFLSFPYGSEGEYPGQYMNVTNEELAAFEAIVKSQGFACECWFFYNLFPQGREKWVDVSRLVASEVPLRGEHGVQCVCLATFAR